jgi:hypothetical protein
MHPLALNSYDRHFEMLGATVDTVASPWIERLESFAKGAKRLHFVLVIVRRWIGRERTDIGMTARIQWL